MYALESQNFEFKDKDKEKKLLQPFLMCFRMVC